MCYGFVKLYCEDEFDGYLSVQDIHLFDIRELRGSDPCFLVMAFSEEDQTTDSGYAVSPFMKNQLDAEVFLHSLIDQLKRF